MKKKQYSYKQKFRGLILVILAGMLIIYRFSFKNTLDSMKNCESLQATRQQVENAPAEIIRLESQLHEYEKFIHLGDPDENQVYLLKLSAELSEKQNIVLSHFPEKHEYREKDLICYTYPITVQGRFLDLLQYLHQFEDDKNAGNVVACEFATEKNRQTKQKELYLILYIQGINKAITYE